jgi:hypothetical protein
MRRFVGVFITLKMLLQIDHLDQLIFVNKNWPYNPRAAYSIPSNLAGA